MPTNIYYINDMPFSLAYGGKEVQLLGYKRIIEIEDTAFQVSLIDPWDRFGFPEGSSLHLFGSGKWFHNLIMQAKQKPEIKKIIVSPTFYYEKIWKLKIGNALSRLTPLEDQFSYKRFIFDNCDTLLVNSHEEGEQVSSVFGSQLEKKLVVIPNTIAEDFGSLENRDCFLSKYQMEPGYILSVGFLDERKNSIRMIQAYLDAYPLVKRKLVLIGGARFLDSKNAKLLNRLIHENKSVIRQIPFLQSGSELIKSAYYNCAFHILPSHVETPGIANLEAIAYGKQIVVGECPPVREYFGDQAIYCNSASLPSIKSAIVSASKTISNEPSKNLIRFLNDNYTHKSIANKLISIYR